METRQKLSSSIEDYLEAIFLLSKEKKAVRVKDISRALNVKMPSVNRALHVLKDLDMILHENYGYIELTDKGTSVGSDIYRKHKVLVKFLNKMLGVSQATAQEDACSMEHHISRETLNKFVEFVDKYGGSRKK
ncbi:MAG: metal-dependent transcriptional regulator [Elusimicrobia bacterium]|nr:metal-dependent transcriptional regulator [Elusimicrobiota bacterium]